jgi:hypothetical protein
MSFTPEARSTGSGDNAPLDPVGWFSLAAGLLVILITFFTSYSHVNLFGVLRFKVNQQIQQSTRRSECSRARGERKKARGERS